MSGIWVKPTGLGLTLYEELCRANLEELIRGGSYVGIATHDEFLVWHALRLIHQLEVSKDRYEFQMLLGVLDRQRAFAADASHELKTLITLIRANTAGRTLCAEPTLRCRRVWGCTAQEGKDRDEDAIYQRRLPHRPRRAQTHRRDSRSPYRRADLRYPGE